MEGKSYRDENKYRADLKSFLRNLIFDRMKTKDSSGMLEGIFSDENIIIWTKVFTTNLEDSNYMNNYEPYEVMGDSCMELYFKVFLENNFVKRPGDPRNDEKLEFIPPRKSTEFSAFYLSKDFQPLISKFLGLMQFIRSADVNVSNNIKILEDISEAFFGGLYIIGNKVKQLLGDGLCKDLMNYIFTVGFQINIHEDKAIPKTEVQQAFNRFNKPGIVYMAKEERRKVDGTTIIEITLNDNAVQLVKNLTNKNIPKIIGRDSSQTSKIKTASRRAWFQAHDTLQKIGLTNEFLTNIKAYFDMTSSEFKDLASQAMKIASEKGFVFIRFETDKQTKGATNMVRLIGIKDGAPHTLGMVGSDDEMKAKRQVLEDYIRKNQIKS